MGGQVMTPEEEEIKAQIRALLPPVGYEKLHRVFQQAMEQAAFGKGCARHSSGEPFHQQPICIIAKWVGQGFQLGQAIKKCQEAARFEGYEATKAELLGAINYIAAAVISLELENDQIR